MLAGNSTPLVWHAASWPRAPWTLLTASLVHLSTLHLLGNLLALGALAALGWAWRADSRAALAWLVAWPLGTLGLLLWPSVTAYAGLSGLLHAGAAVLWAHATGRPGFKPWSFVLFAGLGLKLMVEHAWSQPLAHQPFWGFDVVTAAHLTGTLAGAACGLLLRRWGPACDDPRP